MFPRCGTARAGGVDLGRLRAGDRRRRGGRHRDGRHRPPLRGRAGRRRDRSSSRSPPGSSTDYGDAHPPQRDELQRRRAADRRSAGPRQHWPASATSPRTRKRSASCTTSWSSGRNSDLSARSNDTYITSQGQDAHGRGQQVSAQRGQGRHRARRRLPDGHRVEGGRRRRPRKSPRPRPASCASSSSSSIRPDDRGNQRCPTRAVCPRRAIPAKIATAADALARIARLAAPARVHQRRVRPSASRSRHLSRSRREVSAHRSSSRSIPMRRSSVSAKATNVRSTRRTIAWRSWRRSRRSISSFRSTATRRAS